MTDPTLPLPTPPLPVTGTPAPVPGQAVWYPEGTLTRLRPATVLQVFAGKDGRAWCLLEVEDDYHAIPALGLHATPDGPSYFQQSLKDPAFARAFMQRAGLLDEEGNWRPQFRSDEDEDEDGGETEDTGERQG